CRPNLFFLHPQAQLKLQLSYFCWLKRFRKLYFHQLSLRCLISFHQIPWHKLFFHPSRFQLPFQEFSILDDNFLSKIQSFLVNQFVLELPKAMKQSTMKKQSEISLNNLLTFNFDLIFTNIP